jgi:hypothetical protein
VNERTRRQVIWSCLEYGGKDSIMLAPDEADEISILDLAKTVAECMKFPLERLVQDTTKSDGQFKKTVRAQPARASAKPGGRGAAAPNRASAAARSPPGAPAAAPAPAKTAPVVTRH